MNREKYIIITPVRDEEEYLEKTIRSVISQSIRPIEWIIVNDGSSDNTAEIIEKYVTQYEWIKAIHRENRGFRKAAGGELESFYDGYRSIESSDWGFIVKLDGDLSFGSDYFERCFEHFGEVNKLGICGGGIFNQINGVAVLEKVPLFHVRGATKIYKRECWENIGGFVKTPGWDTLDEVKANMLGWKTRSFFDLKVVHHRYTGSAEGIWKNSVTNGMSNYIAGYHPLFLIIKCIKRVFQRPYLVGSLGIFYGFISGYIKNISQVDDRALIRYLRNQQINRLLFKKSIWK